MDEDCMRLKSDRRHQLGVIAEGLSAKGVKKWALWSIQQECPQGHVEDRLRFPGGRRSGVCYPCFMASPFELREGCTDDDMADPAWHPEWRLRTVPHHFEDTQDNPWEAIIEAIPRLWKRVEMSTSCIADGQWQSVWRMPASDRPEREYRGTGASRREAEIAVLLAVVTDEEVE